MTNKKLLISSLLIGITFCIGKANADTCPAGVAIAITGVTGANCDESFYRCTCNSNGKLIELFSTLGGQSKYTFDYDTNGYLISQTTYQQRSSVQNNTPDQYYRYTYDADGHKTSVTAYYGTDNIQSDNPTPSSQTRYAYDSNGYVFVETIFYGEENIVNNIPSDQISYTYDVDGNETDARMSFCEWDSCEEFPVSVVCAYGYVSGCTGDTVTLSDGRTVFMQGGDILRLISKTSPDGSSILYNEDGTIKGYKGKRIYTIDEANQVTKPTGNTVRIKYR